MKSYVTMAVCPICHKENGTILMDRRLKDTFNKYTVDPAGVCDKCKEEYLSKGVLLIDPKKGDLTVIKDGAFKRIFDKEIPKGKIAFVESGVFQKLGIFN